MSTIDPSAPLTPWTDAERVAHIRYEATRAETRGGKLHRGQVEEIRELYAEGEMTVVAIAARFGVHRNAVKEIARGRQWGYPPLPRRTGRPCKAQERNAA